MGEFWTAYGLPTAITVAYIVGKEGVHTPAPVRHGFASIVQAARREFDLSHAKEVRERLHHADGQDGHLAQALGRRWRLRHHPHARLTAAPALT